MSRPIRVRWLSPGRPTVAELRAICRYCEKHACKSISAKRATGRRRNPSSPAEAEFTRFHWGEKPTKKRRVRLPDYSGGLYELGKVTRVEYLASKGGERAVWVHDFEKPLPSLTATARGRLGPIVGGNAIVTERGIER